MLVQIVKIFLVGVTQFLNFDGGESDVEEIVAQISEWAALVRSAVEYHA